MRVKTFHVGDVLSVYFGTVLSPTGMKGVYALTDHLLETNLTHDETIEKLGECGSLLSTQFPWLMTLEDPDLLSGNAREEWGTAISTTHGIWLSVLSRSSM